MNQEPLKTLSTLCTDVMRCDQFRFAARAVASELDTPLGNAVGYKVRFSDKLSLKP